ncbi:SDR family NAD(P)-dependent oxidoreductase [Flammeovirga agarivorans]|uniref:SDR family NAD(P)-dependent oxidoreductase n=1 Tax=Flammeovirga agarivorans TaxID=2726742 RepID=A0A7X8XY13_9BACT|nr:SDR family NAD(P)-dependent oxidoreductase [Flammeovirga agarivorans]NLR93767.1 SDR family NAD(P)-dependent oxidoreductase [Flammeovirga agarivorans]
MKTILITGASSGFGKLLTQQLAQKEQYHIVATMRNTDSSNATVKKELESLHNVDVLALDVTSEEEVQHVTQKVAQKYSSIDILINNAGVFGGGLLEAHSITQVQKLFDVNVYAPLRLMKAVLPSMRQKQDGLIINLSSMLGFFSIPLNAVYCASKFALEALVSGSYSELISKGVENILVEPGSFPTTLYQKSGIKADLSDVTLSYAGWAEQMTAYANQAVYKAIQENQPDPQAVVQKIIDLISMEKGSRPMRNPIDQISGEDFAQKVAHDIESLAQTQMKAYGF